jgi:hypothetical protein
MGYQYLPRLFGIFWVLITLPQIYYFGLRGYEGEGPLQVLFNVNSTRCFIIMLISVSLDAGDEAV